MTALGCPVCGEPQADAEHLADHLAFVALLGDDDHESWLDEHAPGWEADGTEELTERVAPEASEVDVDVPTSEEQTDEPGRRERPQGRDGERRLGEPGGVGGLDPEDREIVDDARRMTREMRGDADGDDGGSASESDSDE